MLVKRREQSAACERLRVRRGDKKRRYSPIFQQRNNFTQRRRYEPRSTTQNHAASRSTTQHHATPRSITQHHAASRSITQHHAAPRSTTQHHAAHAASRSITATQRQYNHTSKLQSTALKCSMNLLLLLSFISPPLPLPHSVLPPSLLSLLLFSPLISSSPDLRSSFNSLPVHLIFLASLLSFTHIITRTTINYYP